MAGLKLVALSMYCISLIFCNSQNRVEQDVKVEQTKIAYVDFMDSDSMKNIEVMVEIADNDHDRAKGLMFREDLPENQGMLFIFNEEKERNFWMKNTPTSLDIIFIDTQFKIIKIHKDTTPFSTQNYPSVQPAKYVVEVRAGFTERYQVTEGTWIRVNEL